MHSAKDERFYKMGENKRGRMMVAKSENPRTRGMSEEI